MTDKEYDKAEEKSLQDYLNGELRVALHDPVREHEWLAHKTGFRDGFKLAQSQPVSNPDKFGNSEQLRAQAAIAAMQGLLSNEDSQCVAMQGDGEEKPRQYPIGIAKYAVACANALLAELDKTKEK